MSFCNRLTHEDKLKLMSMYFSGYHRTDLKKEFGFKSDLEVINYLESQGVDTLIQVDANKYDSNLKEITRLHKEEGLIPEEIINNIPYLSISGVRKLLVEKKLTLPPSLLDIIKRKEVAVKLICEFSTKRAAEYMGVTPRNLSIVVKELNLIKDRFKVFAATKNEIAELSSKGFSKEEIEKKLQIFDIGNFIKLSVFLKDLPKIISLRREGVQYQAIIEMLGYGTKQQLASFLKDLNIQEGGIKVTAYLKDKELILKLCEAITPIKGIIRKLGYGERLSLIKFITGHLEYEHYSIARLTSESIERRDEEIIRLYHKGVKFAEIAKKYDLNPGYIDYILTKHGIVKIRVDGEKFKKFDKQIKQCIEKKMKSKEIAKELGLENDNYLRFVLRTKYGIKCQPSKEQSAEFRRQIEDNYEKIVELKKQKIPVDKIIEKLDLSCKHSLIYKIFKEKNEQF